MRVREKVRSGELEAGSRKRDMSFRVLGFGDAPSQIRGMFSTRGLRNCISTREVYVGFACGLPFQGAARLYDIASRPKVIASCFAFVFASRPPNSI